VFRSGTTGVRSGRGAILNESAQGKQDGKRSSRLALAGSAGESGKMRATRTRSTRGAGRRARPVKRAVKRLAAKVAAKPAGKVVVPLEPVLYKLCKAGWAVIVDRTPNALGTRFVCPFCPRSHRVPGPVRGFKKMRHAQWGRLRRVEE
jgi:hypothetical protein